MASYSITDLQTESEIAQCWEVALALRPHLNKKDWFPMVSEMIQNEKYHLAGIIDGNRCIAFAGYRRMTSLHTGSILYIDDLCTLESHRGKGLASQLLEHVHAIAQKTGLDAVVLDTDFNNTTAQKVYLKHGFRLAALHLTHNLKVTV